MLTSRALAVSRSSFGTDHTQTLGAMAQLAVIKFLAGNIVEAETLYFQIRDIDHRTGRSVLEEFRRHPEFVTMENSIVPSADGS
jgi:hypothetical protein